MLRIKTFGGLNLEQAGARFEGASPRRSALLAILAVAGKRGVSRDRLLLYLWPDTSEERARHNLAQTVYTIQKAVGTDVIESVGTELRLAPGVESDVADFLEAKTRGDTATMARLYEGPFLDGFILSDSAEFDEWASAERARFSGIAIDAIEAQAKEADRANQPEAVGLWRRLAVLDPVATRFAMGLARALSRTGDPGAAARHLRDHERILRSEVGAAPPAEFHKLLESLGRVQPPMPDAGESAGPARPPEPGGGAPVPTAGPAPTPADPAVRQVPTRRRLGRVVAIAVAVAVVGGTLGYRALTRPAHRLANGEVVVLADIDNQTGDPAMGRALQVAAAVSLQQSTGFSLYPRNRLRESLTRMGRPPADSLFSEEVAREVAVREGGRVVVAMTVARLGQQFVLAASLIQPEDGRVMRSHKVAVKDESKLLDGVDEMGAWVRRQLGDVNWKPTRALPLLTTQSLAALEAVAEAQAAQRQARWVDAKAALERALAADTGFAMAMRMLGDHYINTNRVTDGLKWLRSASDRKDRLTEQEQIAVRAAMAQAEGRWAEAITATRELATRFPSPTNWGWLGEALRRGGSYPEAMTAFSKASELAPTSPEPHYGMALVHKHLGDIRASIDEFEKIFQLDSTLLLRDFRNMQWGESYVLTGQLAQAESVFRRMTKVQSASEQARGYRALGYLAIYQGQFAKAAEQIRIGLGLGPRASLSEYRDQALLADVELTRGQAAAAKTALDAVWDIFRKIDIQAAAIMFGGHQLVRAGELGRARVMLDTLRRRAALRPNHPQDQAALAILTADLALAEGSVATAEAALASRAFDEYPTLGNSLLAEVMVSRNRLDSAFTTLRSVVEAKRFGYEMQEDWLRSFERLARVAERAGDSATARAAYSALINQWKDGDADLPPLVAARRELARLQSASGR